MIRACLTLPTNCLISFNSECIVPFLMRRLGLFSLSHCADTVGPVCKVAPVVEKVRVIPTAYDPALLAVNTDEDFHVVNDSHNSTSILVQIPLILALCGPLLPFPTPSGMSGPTGRSGAVKSG